MVSSSGAPPACRTDRSGPCTASVPNATNPVTIVIGTNPGGGTLGGTTTLNAVNAVATFANLTIDRPGTGYTLTATAPGVIGAATAKFTITATPASIIKVSGDGQFGLMGCPLPAPLVVQVNDRNNQPVGGIAVSGGFGTTGTNGQASRYWVLSSRAYLQTVTASVANVGSVTFVARAGINWKGCYSYGPPPPAIGLSPSSVSFTATRGERIPRRKR